MKRESIAREPFRLLGLHWLMLVITGVLLFLVATFVDLRPVVDENFFFSTSDPGIQQTKAIERKFPSQPEVILAVSSRDNYRLPRREPCKSLVQLRYRANAYS